MCYSAYVPYGLPSGFLMWLTFLLLRDSHLRKRIPSIGGAPKNDKERQKINNIKWIDGTHAHLSKPSIADASQSQKRDPESVSVWHTTKLNTFDSFVRVVHSMCTLCHPIHSEDCVRYSLSISHTHTYTLSLSHGSAGQSEWERSLAYYLIWKFCIHDFQLNNIIFIIFIIVTFSPSRVTFRSSWQFSFFGRNVYFPPIAVAQ